MAETIDIAPYLELSGKALEDAYFQHPKPVRKAVYPHLKPAQQEYLRPIVEARRGITRVDGKIVLSGEQIAEKVEQLQAKQDDLKNRLANIKANLRKIQ
jgi:hypothetical protein